MHRLLIIAFLFLPAAALGQQWKLIAPNIDPNTEQCGDGLDPHNNSIKSKGNNDSQSIQEDTSDVYCYNLTEIAHRYWEDGIPSSYKKSNDTFRLFIEQCGYKHEIQNYGSPAGGFQELPTDVYSMDTTNKRWIEFREWLFKVLYYNSDTVYYCRDVDAMFSTFNYIIPGKGIDYNGEIAVYDYLIKNNRCPDEEKYLIQGRKGARDFEIQHWRDTVRDSVATPLDTSTVTIDQIGFSILRGPQFGVVTPHNLQKEFGNLSASQNPFKEETTLETIIGEAMMLKLQILDVLGRELYSENKFFSAGDVRWLLDGRTLPEGSLYARISTIDGKVQTIKLVHEN